MKEDKERMPTVILRVAAQDNELGGGFVAEFECLPIAMMEKPPEVVMWGSRFFVFKKRRSNEDCIYVEALCYPLVEGATAKSVEPSYGGDM